jgi:hypothetical protein
MTLTSKVRVEVSASQTGTIDLGGKSASASKSVAVAFADGVAAGQANRCWQDTRQIAASGTDDIDLSGTLLDAFGGGNVFVKVKAIIIAAAATNTNNVIVGGAASAGFISWVGAATHTVTIRPGGVFGLSCGAGDLNGYAVTATSADILRVANSGAGTVVDYDIIVLGTSS